MEELICDSANKFFVVVVGNVCKFFWSLICLSKANIFIMSFVAFLASETFNFSLREVKSLDEMSNRKFSGILV